MNTQFYRWGTLTVQPAGFWFTAGGEKGSFGYYPHLKDGDGYPVYPDTQLHGDLKMAARLVAPAAEVRKFFGAEQAANSKLFISDLELTPESKNLWRKERFVIKPRIKIDCGARTVAEHFYADLELAWFGGMPDDLPEQAMTLTAQVCLGPFDTTDDADRMEAINDADRMEAIIRQSLPRLSGFGAFRSRGYSSGALAVEFTNTSALSGLSSEDEQSVALHHGRYTYALKALFHVRNRPIDPGSAQVVTTAYAITPAQFKAWFAKTYARLYNVWPTPAEMALIEVTTLRPSWDTVTVTLPSPMSTLLGNGVLRDCLSIFEQETPDSKKFFAAKPKGLHEGWFVTSLREAFEQPAGRRMRNSIDGDREEDAVRKFVTIKNGLFSQEYLPRGAVFTGTIALNDPKRQHAAFVNRAWRLIMTGRQAINGALFEPETGVTPHPDAPRRLHGKPLLVTEPIPFQPAHHDERNRITLGTLRGYHVALKRPRRPQIVTLPSSVLRTGGKDTPATAVTPWPGFDTVLLRDFRYSPLHHELRAVNLAAVSDAQAGQLRRMALLPPELLETVLSKRIEQFRAKSGHYHELLKVYEMIRRELAVFPEAMRAFIDELLEAIALQRWNAHEELVADQVRQTAKNNAATASPSQKDVMPHSGG